MIRGYEEKYVKDLVPSDVKVAVSGMVIGRWERGIMVDDGTGCVNVELETGPFVETKASTENSEGFQPASDMPDGKFVKVFGYLTFLNEGFELKGNLIQDLSSADRELYEKVKKLMTKR